MDSAKSWFHKFQQRDRLRTLRTVSRKKDSMGSAREEPPADLLADDEASTLTKQKVAAAKQYIENHYKEQMRNLQERRQRYSILPKLVLAALFLKKLSSVHLLC